VEASAIQVKYSESPGSPPSQLLGLPSKFHDLVAPYFEEAKQRYGKPNNRKFGVEDLQSPLSDRPTLQITVGETDYWTTRALGLACEKGSLRAAFENRTFDVLCDVPGLLATHSFAITSDDKLVLALRKQNDVDAAGGPIVHPLRNNGITRRIVLLPKPFCAACQKSLISIQTMESTCPLIISPARSGARMGQILES